VAHDPTPAPATALLEIRGVSKAFPGVLALDDVSVHLRSGSVHALMGENGAGKSTLMKIVAGIYVPDAGELRLEGRPLRLGSPRQALQCGIAMIHQELNLLPPMTVAENIWIGREPLNALRFVNHRELHHRTRSLLQQLRIDIDPGTPLRSLSVAGRQLIEIAKALSHNSRILIMDEPTSALTEHDAGQLFDMIRDLKVRGTGIFYITHKMDELTEIADDVSVFRDGRHIATATARSLTREEIIRMMVGRELAQAPPLPASAPGPAVLAVRALRMRRATSEISFELHAGEIFGVAGLIGSGRSQLGETLFGLTPAAGGQILLDGREVRIDCPRTAMQRGMALLTEDRKESGCFLKLSVLENLEIAVLGREFTRWGFVRRRALAQTCTDMSRSLRVKSPHLGECIANLSGGNQQKVLLGRCLLTRPRILILDEPSRGVDVGAKAEIHQLIARLASGGTAVLMISSELPEILALSHRVMVMHGGRVTGILGRAEADQVRIMQLAAQ
jgi:inositol transport system ATP-binding protein